MASKFIGDHSGDGSLLSNVDASTLGGLANTAFAKRADSASNGFWSLDSRAVNDLPADRGRGVYADFKANTTNGLSDGGTYNGVITFRTYGGTTDLSGGMPHQLGFTENGNVWHRKGSTASAWNGWNKMWHSGNDGAGSGLDADLLDGLQSTSFVRGDTADTFTTLTGTSLDVSGELEGQYIGVGNSANNTGYGLSLYGGGVAGQPTYGIMFAGTGTFGTHGSVTADWATYFTMNNTAGRGWVFRNATGATNVASISNAGHAVFNGDVTAYSDERMKDNIASIEGAMDKVSQLRGITFNHKSDGTASTGLIAQDVQKVLPEAITEDSEGMLAVKYGNMVGLLVEGMKEMKATIDAQAAKIADLENKLNGK